MRLIQYLLKSKPTVSHVGIRLGQEVIDLSSIDSTYPSTLIQLLNQKSGFLEDLLKVDLSRILDRIPISLIDLTAPIKNPDKVICVGMNYSDHCKELNSPVPTEPVFFSKFPSAITGPFDPITYPAVTEQLDWEVELAFVIGKAGKNIPLEQAMDHVLGYTVAQDVSARDWLFDRNGGQWLIGKSMDQFCPIGPEIVTKDEISNLYNLGIRCLVNGVAVQDSSTAEIIHKIDAIVSFLSRMVTLLPGDLVLTGTPPGAGCFRKPPFFLKRGDIVECEIDEIGRIRNPII